MRNATEEARLEREARIALAVQPSFEDLSRDRVAVALSAGDGNADRDWKAELYDAIVRLAPGDAFMAEDLVRGLDATTHDHRAAGAVIQRARRAGLIVSGGAELDRWGSWKTKWIRTEDT